MRTVQRMPSEAMRKAENAQLVVARPYFEDGRGREGKQRIAPRLDGQEE